MIRFSLRPALVPASLLSGIQMRLLRVRGLIRPLLSALTKPDSELSRQFSRLSGVRGMRHNMTLMVKASSL